MRERRAIYSPDKEHIHHKLLALGLRDTSILVIIYALCAYLAVGSIASLFLPRTHALILLAIVWATAVLGYAILNGIKQKRKAVQAPLARQ